MTQRRRSIRLQGYDYSTPGAYFVTICTRNRECLFGEVVNDQMNLNDLGKIVGSCWYDLPNHYSNVELDAFIVMPNHLHGILVLNDSTREGLRSSPTPTRLSGLPEVIRALKSFSSRRINEIRGTQGVSIWQRGYYEHVVRDEDDLDQIQEYIVHNASRWSDDIYNPNNIER